MELVVLDIDSRCPDQGRLFTPQRNLRRTEDIYSTRATENVSE